jgi:hypothetical protein
MNRTQGNINSSQLECKGPYPLVRFSQELIPGSFLTNGGIPRGSVSDPDPHKVRVPDPNFYTDLRIFPFFFSKIKACSLPLYYKKIIKCRYIHKSPKLSYREAWIRICKRLAPWIRIHFEIWGWIRIRMKRMRIRNTAQEVTLVIIWLEFFKDDILPWILPIMFILSSCLFGTT